MSETHHTTTTTYRTTVIADDGNFVTSLSGILKIIELICGLLCWALTSAYFGGPANAAFGYIMFVSVTAWILTLISFFIFSTGIHTTTTCSGAPWVIMEFAFNTFWAVAYFIAACVSALHTLSYAAAAAAAFAFLTDFAYIAHVLFYFKEWRRGYPWIRGTSAGTTVNALFCY